MFDFLHVNRSAVAYWILGLCNNFGFVVMLSAAHDILARDKTGPHDVVLNKDRQCNYLSTGVILLADVLPSLTVKFILPFLPLWMNIRMIIVVFSAASGLILVGLSQSLLLALIGVVCTSFSSGMGENTLLSYTVFYKSKSIISAWSSGTGGAGFFGSLTYAGLIAIGISPSNTLFLMLSIPVLMALSFWLILLSPAKTERVLETAISKPNEAEIITPTEINTQSFFLRLKELPAALKYIIPLLVVYYCEYLINQGLYELSLVENSFLDRSTQYRWYQVFYQIGVFISRSSIGIVKIEKLWILSILQAINVAYFTLEAIYKFTNNVFLILIIILWEGLLGGASYVNTFYRIQIAEEPEKREVITGLTTISDSVGVTIAGFTAIPLHNKICTLPKF